MTPEDRTRRRTAKPFNERLKLQATFCNNVAIATVAGGYVLPMLSGKLLDTRQSYLVVAYVLVLHIVAQAAMILFRSED